MSPERRSVTFPSGSSITVAGDLWVPADFDEHTRYRALVLGTPGSSVKEQIGANYASRLADRGFVALTFDPSYQGQSGGQPRDLEDPAARVEDMRSAVDFLTTLDYIDDERIGILGICAAGGYTVSAAMTDHRIKAVGTVVGVNIGRAFRQAAAASPDGMTQTLEAVGQQRTVEARGGAPRRDPWIPDTPEQAQAAGITDREVLDAIDFYRTPRGYNEHSTNRLLFRSNATLMGYDAFHLVGELLNQPLQAIVGGRIGTTGSYQDGLQLCEQARNTRDLLIIDGAGHYDFYDKPEYVDQAVARLTAFYQASL